MVVKSIELLRIIEWLNKMKIENYTINDDLSVDVEGSVWLDNKGLTEIPIQFNKVNGRFTCYNNKLTSLKGCPREVGRRFDCSFNKVKFNVEDIRKVCQVGETIYV